MDNRPNSINHLFEMLKDKPSFKNKISITNEKLNIVLSEKYKISVVLKIGQDGGFHTYINDSFYYNIEEQDIVESLIDMVENPKK